MHKSLFQKYLLITMSIVLGSYVILGSVMMFFFSDYWENEKKYLLTKNVAAVSSIVQAYTSYDQESDSYVIKEDIVNIFVEILARNIDADVFITDIEGNRLMGSYPSSYSTEEDLIKVNQEQVDIAMSGFYEGRGNFGNTYDGVYYTVGIPLTIIAEDGTTTVAGAIFAATNVSSISAYMLSTFQIFLWAAIATLAITFVLVWGFTYRMVKPLRQMSRAAKLFGDGDFGSRVSISSHDEIGELSVAFNNMANSLSNSEDTRRSFIANVSHELKTPMTTIAGFIDGILDGTIPPERQKHYLKIVSDEVKRLSRLVKSMLDLSRIDSGEMKINPTRFDITDKVFTIILTFEQKIEENEIEILGLDNANPINVTGDQDLLYQVIYNLVENAVKFTNPKGFINISVYDTFDRVFVSIENSGPGIAQDELPMIFDRFYKTDKSRSQDKNGMGLGLYLVKKIVKFHGGDIIAQSTPNGSTKFEFYLPNVDSTKNKILDGSIINLSPTAEVDIQDVE